MKTTKDHFTIFEKEVLRLLKMYGLLSWEYHIWHDELDDASLSGVHVEFPARQIMISLNKTWVVNSITRAALQEVAHHEVLEALFYKLENMVCEHKKEDAREEVHAIIQTIINVNRS